MEAPDERVGAVTVNPHAMTAVEFRVRRVRVRVGVCRGLNRQFWNTTQRDRPTVGEMGHAWQRSELVGKGGKRKQGQ